MIVCYRWESKAQERHYLVQSNTTPDLNIQPIGLASLTLVAYETVWWQMWGSTFSKQDQVSVRALLFSLGGEFQEGFKIWELKDSHFLKLDLLGLPLPTSTGLASHLQPPEPLWYSPVSFLLFCPQDLAWAHTLCSWVRGSWALPVTFLLMPLNGLHCHGVPQGQLIN